MAFTVEYIRRFEDACEIFLSLMEKQGFKETEKKEIDYGAGYVFLKDGRVLKAALYYNKSGNSTKVVFSGDAGDPALKSIAGALRALSDKPVQNEFALKREIKEIPVLECHIGTDESGKGDYFGPLVIAGVFVNTRLENILKELGAADSKTNTDR